MVVKEKWNENGSKVEINYLTSKCEAMNHELWIRTSELKAMNKCMRRNFWDEVECILYSIVFESLDSSISSNL